VQVLQILKDSTLWRTVGLRYLWSKIRGQK
jgi:hypothetical protein